MTDTVEKVENRTATKISRRSVVRSPPLLGSLRPIGRFAVAFVQINVVPHVAARGTHQRSRKIWVVGQKGLFQTLSTHFRHRTTFKYISLDQRRRLPCVEVEQVHSCN